MADSKQEQRQKDELRWVQNLLLSAQKRDWYGRITIEVKHGQIDVVRSEESLKNGQMGLHGEPAKV